jgi:hypothetical protein
MTPDGRAGLSIDIADASGVPPRLRLCRAVAAGVNGKLHSHIQLHILARHREAPLKLAYHCSRDSCDANCREQIVGAPMLTDGQ